MYLWTILEADKLANSKNTILATFYVCFYKLIVRKKKIVVYMLLILFYMSFEFDYLFYVIYEVEQSKKLILKSFMLFSYFIMRRIQMFFVFYVFIMDPFKFFKLFHIKLKPKD